MPRLRKSEAVSIRSLRELLNPQAEMPFGKLRGSRRARPAGEYVVSIRSLRELLNPQNRSSTHGRQLRGSVGAGASTLGGERGHERGELLRVGIRILRVPLHAQDPAIRQLDGLDGAVRSIR
jgi:hypothetical protein